MVIVYTESMSTYHYKNHQWDAQLAARRDELVRRTAVRQVGSRFVIADFPEYSFASTDDAARFLERLVRANKQMAKQRSAR